MAQANPQTTTRFRVIDRQTGAPVGGAYTNVRRARARRDALDLRHGAIRYAVKQVAA